MPKQSTSRASEIRNKKSFDAAFASAYEKLNEAQKKAVDSIEGPVLVVAGPGTGKTQVLTMRIANILRRTDTKPSSILALTFTESAAQNMRLRLASLIGPDAYYVHISTFHSFCAQVIANHLEYFPLNPSSEPITDLERFELLRTIVEELPLEAVKPLNSPLFHVKSLMSNISAYKREGVSPDKLRELVEGQWQDPETITSRTKRMRLIKRQQQLTEQITVYEAYQQRMRAAGRYDFDDMLSLTVEVLSREEVLLQEYQEQYLYLLVDEYQDTNAVQNRVTHLLSSFWGEEANIFAVGDPHQSIYRFQGASLENISEFIQWYPNAEVVTLSIGYRCPPKVYDAAHDVIQRDTSLSILNELGESGQKLQRALQEPLAAASTIDTPLSIVKAPEYTTSLIALVENIKTLLNQGTPADEIAILYTKNKFAADLLPLLEKWSIPYYLEGGLNALEQPVIHQFLTLCIVLVALRQGTDVSPQLFEVCTYPWFGIDRVTLFQLARFAGKEKKTLLEVLEQPVDTLQNALGDGLDSDSVQIIKQKLGMFELWAAQDFQMLFTAWLELIVSESGLHQYLIDRADEQLEPLLALYSLFSFVKKLNTTNQQFHITDFIRAIETLREQGVKIPLQSLSNPEQKIRLSTVHKAKGQEWDHVFILHVVDGVWGNRRAPSRLPVPEHIVETASVLARQSPDQINQDDRRLFYVAMTRAKKNLQLWYSETTDQDGIARQKVPSIFISELDHRDDIVRTEAVMQHSPAEVASILTGPVPKALEHDRMEQYLKQIVTDLPLSITALNNYLKDTSVFFYQNLLALPSVKLPHLAYGTAVHAALELAAEPHDGTKQPLQRVLQRFDQQLQRELLTAEERQRRRDRGYQVLTAYLREQNFTQSLIWQTEYKIGYGTKAAFLDDIRLTGRMDRLDWLDEKHTTVRVIDYKTGKPKTKNEILAETQTAKTALSAREQSLPLEIQGPYQRQLLFYRLLATLDRSFAPEISLGTFDFVEAPLDRGKLVEHSFELKSEDVRLLEELIREVMSEIRSLSFLETTEASEGLISSLAL